MKKSEKLEFPTIEFTPVTFLGTGNSGQSCELNLTEEELKYYPPDEIESVEVQIVRN